MNELDNTVWESETATETVARSAMSGLQILQQQLTGACICNGEWLQCALDIFARSPLNEQCSLTPLSCSLLWIRAKAAIYLSVVQHIVAKRSSLTHNGSRMNATCSYALLGVEDKEVIFLTDFRWSPVILPWNDMLLLLEGHIVHFAAPKITYNQDSECSKDTPIFATSRAPISYIKGSMTNDRETEMMAVRWRTFKVRHHFDITCQRPVPSCGYCFATLVVQ